MAGTTWPALTAGNKAKASEVEAKFDWIEGSLVPMNAGGKTNSAYDLGEASYKWNNLYVNTIVTTLTCNQLVTFNSGISVSGTSTFFQPVIASGGLSVSGTATFFQPIVTTDIIASGPITANGGIYTTSITAHNGLTVSGTSTFFNPMLLSQFTAGSILFAGSNGLLSQDNSNLFWDNVNKRLGIGTASPGHKFQVRTGTNGVFVIRSGIDFGYSGIAIDSLNDATTDRMMLTIAGDPVVFYGGNVGIGLTSPSSKLEVVGTITAIEFGTITTTKLLTASGGVSATTITASGLITASGGISATTITATSFGTITCLGVGTGNETIRWDIVTVTLDGISLDEFTYSITTSSFLTLMLNISGTTTTFYTPGNYVSSGYMYAFHYNSSLFTIYYGTNFLTNSVAKLTIFY